MRHTHLWSEWQDTDVPCHGKRSCRRENCRAVEERQQHLLGQPESTPTQPCARFRRCQREGCPKVENLADHHSDEWVYAPDVEGVLTRIPPESRDLVVMALQALLGVADPVSEVCEQVEICTRCGRLSGRRRIQHEWGPWSAGDNDTLVRICARNGERETKRAASAGSTT